METVIKNLHWGPDQAGWQQVGSKDGPHWHKGGVRWVSFRQVVWNGKPIQVGNITQRCPNHG